MFTLSPSPRFESLERRYHFAVTANDPLINHPGMYGLNQIDAPSAWAVTTGSPAVVVANIDSGVDFAHPDLYLNIWINQGEVPFPIGTPGGLVESPDYQDGILTFHDLNYRLPDNSLANAAFVSDLNNNGYIDGEDLIFNTRWVNGQDDDGNGYVDDLIGWDFVHNDNDPYDYDGHGTHTAGTIGAIGNNGIGISGVAWNVQIMPLKIFPDSGGGAAMSYIAEAIRYAADNGARISNNSYGAAFGSEGDILSQAIRYAATKDHLFVAAAGNDGRLIDREPPRSYPAAYNIDHIISVAAADSSNRRASFSNFGAISVDLMAPGVGILSTVPGGYARFSGTSMAAPHVTGAAALLLSRDPSLTALEVKELLLSTVNQDPSLTYFVASSGSLNVGRAMHHIGSNGTTTIFSTGSTLTQEGLKALVAMGHTEYARYLSSPTPMTFSTTPLADVLDEAEDVLPTRPREVLA